MRAHALAAAALVLPLALAPTAGAEPAVTLSAGIDLTTNYISGGATETSNSPAVQPFVELEVSGFYVGAWASNVRAGGRTDYEYDLMAGFRNEFGAFSYDVGYVRYLYVRDGDCCGEAYIGLGWQATDTVGLNADLARDFDQDETTGGLGAAFALPKDFELSAYLERAFEANEFNWNLGISRPLTETISADLRYHQVEGGDALVNFTLSIAFDWRLN